MSNASILGVRARRLLVTVHVTTSIALLGADLVLLALGIVGLRGAAPETVYPAAYLVATRILAPLAIGALLTGLSLAVLTPWGPLQHRWVALKLSITVALTALVLFVLVPAVGQAAEESLASVPAIPTAQKLRFVIAPSVASALLLLNVVLGAYKPRLRASGASSASASEG